MSNKDLHLAYVLSEEQFLELDQIVDGLQQQCHERQPQYADLIERLFLLRGQLSTCPELREYPLAPRILHEMAAPLTEREIRELVRFGPKLMISLPLALQTENEPVDWRQVYLRIERQRPADLALFRACLRKVLMYTDCRPQDVEAVMLYLNERSTGGRSSNPEGWLEHGLVITGRSGDRFVMGCIQRTLQGDPEFHS